ncbi:DUF11 domain-containing protein [Paenibacillus rigui]|uniref:DUF11 domain-containing protein n=1 Tax=Paenibacillus rigui TaxID=554312 RepID=A0A229UHZ6_9BACL|nr:DUF11 domain-containing protein [Paenibacillus rigui]OXM83058.1 hypothetical protein CF651_27995 [Paenibacillus rigui]
MPFVLRYSDNDTGAITFTGNTLGLSRSSTPGQPGTRDIIGAFVTTNTSLQYGYYPPGTTPDFNLDSASAFLRLPRGSKVKYAELVWAGTYAVTGGENNYLAFIDKSVFLTTPAGITFSIAPDPATAQVSYRNATYNYLRSANVTSIIQAGGAGEYTVGGVVGNIDYGTSTGNSCGWTLCVVYENPSLPFRNLSLDVGIVEIAAGGAPQVTTTITGFATPTSGAISGRMALCAQDGDVNKTGDQVLFGPTEDTLTVLQGPNNFADNFFASQINDDSGNLDTSGTFGDRNAINGDPGTQTIGGRQGWDITNVDISGTLTNNQTSAVFEIRTSGDGYSVLAVGIYIDINSPRITVDKSVDAAQAVLGQVLTYTVVIENTGTVPADTTLMFDNLPNDTQFIPGTVTINEISDPNADPVEGIPLGTIPPDGAVTVTYQVRVVSLPPDGVIVNQALVTFEYQSITDGPIFTGDIPSNEVVTPLLLADVRLEKTVSPTAAVPGQEVVYRFQITNTGEVDLTNVRLTDPLLGLDRTIPSLPVGQSVVITQAFVVPPETLAGIINNTATVTSQQTDPVQDHAQVTVLPVYELAIRKSADKTEITAGETVQYTITVTNTGNATLTSLHITDPLLGVDRTFPSLAPGQSIVIDAAYVAADDAKFGTIITNTAIATSAETGPKQAQAVVSVTGKPPVDIIKSVFPHISEPGATLTFTLIITNTTGMSLTSRYGATVLHKLVLFDNLPEGMRLVANSVVVNGNIRRRANLETGVHLGTLDPGETIKVTFHARQLVVPPNEKGENQAYVTFEPEQSDTTYQVDSNTVVFDVVENEE